MADRLTAVDVSVLEAETTSRPAHVGSVQLFESPAGGFDHERLVRLIRERIAYVPRFRRRLRGVPGGLANPVWVDDESFDVTYHVRRSALPRPGTRDQLDDLVARIMGRPLERHRPLWELYLVEGLEDGGFALLSKTHEAMIDGLSSVDLGQVILDATPVPRDPAPDHWRPQPEPSSLELIASAIGDALRRPADAVTGAWQSVTDSVSDLREAGSRVGEQVVSLAAAAARIARPAVRSVLTTEVGGARRFATLDLPLVDLRQIREHQGGTVNDVVLAIIAGGLRSWLLEWGDSLDPARPLRAMVPVSVESDDVHPMSRVEPLLLDLPLADPDPLARLHRITFDMAEHGRVGHLLGARSIADAVGFAPPTLHALGARVGASLTRRAASLVIANVPGPQHALYASGSRLRAAYPVVPLPTGHALSIGATSYDGRVFLGITSDRDVIDDLTVLIGCLTEAAAELVEAAPQQVARRPFTVAGGAA